MKLIVTSDIHLGITSFDNVYQMVEDIIKHKPDILVLAGDITDGNISLDKALELFDRSNIFKGIVLGNHDLWNFFGKTPTKTIWEDIAPKVAMDHEFIWLEDEIIYYDDVAIVGTIAWYDYQHSPLYNNNDEFFRMNKNRYNNDGNYIDWEKTDIEFAKECREKMISKLEVLQSNPNINKIVIVTHVPILSEQMVYYSMDSPIGNAYFGHFSLGKEVLKYDKVTHIISGHTHRTVKKKIGNMNIYTLGSDYNRPGYITINI